MAETVLVITTLLGIGFLATRVSGLLGLPHSVLLVLVGMLGGLTLTGLHVPIPASFWDAFPDLVLYVLLPPLIFEAAYNLSVDDLRRDLGPIMALAVGALLISCAAVGAGLHVWLGITLPAALLFGALISATDPVAVVALFKELGAPRRLATLVESESLLNDGTAIVLFRVLSSALDPQAGSGNLLLDGSLQFLAVALGGVAVGLVVVLAVSRLLRITNPSATAQLGLTVASAYGSFILADHYAHVSGVIATMVVGLYLGHRARLELNREALHSMHVLWEFLSLCANTLIFLAVGLSMNLDLLQHALPYLVPTLFIVGLARAVSVWGTMWWPFRERVGSAYQTVLIWGGLRGGLALALVFILPTTFAYRPLFLALASGVVLWSLLVNALTTSPLLRRLGLTALTPQETSLYQESLKAVLQGVVDELATASQRGNFSSLLVSDVRQQVEKILGQTAEDAPSTAFQLQRLLLFEQNVYNEQVEEGVLSPAAYLSLSHMVTERLALLSNRPADLPSYPFDMPLQHSHWGRTPAEMEALTLSLEQRLHLDLGLRAADQHQAADDTTRDVRQAWLATSQRQLETFYQTFPQLGIAVQAEYLAHRLDVSARLALDDMRSAGVIEGAVHARALDRWRSLHAALLEDAARRLDPKLVDLLPKVPLFAALPASALQELAQAAQPRPYSTGTAVVTEDSGGDSLFVVLSGMLEVRGRLFDKAESRPRLFCGSFFGEMSLLFNTPRTATVVAVVPSQVAEISRAVFDHLVQAYPAVQAEVQRIATERQQQNRQTATPSADRRLYGLLAGVPLLADLPVSALGDLAEQSQLHSLQDGDMVVREGDPGSSFFIVADGVLEVTSHALSQGIKLETGNFFGEMSLLFGGPRTANVTARGPAQVLEIAQPQFDTLMCEHPALAQHVLRIAEARLTEI